MDDLECNIESLLVCQARAWAEIAWLKTGFLEPGAKVNSLRPRIPVEDWPSLRARLNKLLAEGEVTRNLTEQIGDLESRLP